MCQTVKKKKKSPNVPFQIKILCHRLKGCYFPLRGIASGIPAEFSKFRLSLSSFLLATMRSPIDCNTCHGAAIKEDFQHTDKKNKMTWCENHIPMLTFKKKREERERNAKSFFWEGGRRVCFWFNKNIWLIGFKSLKCLLVLYARVQLHSTVLNKESK